jgi:hypothetical protein
LKNTFWRISISMKSICFQLLDGKQHNFLGFFFFSSGFRQPDFSVVLLKVTTMEKPSWFLNIYHSRGTGHLYLYIFIIIISSLSTLRMYKSQWTLRYWYPHSKEISIYIFPEKELRGLSPNFHILVSIYSYDQSTYLFSCSTIGRPIVGIYKSLTETGM